MTAAGISILADDREVNGGVIAALRAEPGVSVRMTRLALGDYLVDQDLLVERKTLADLAASIADGRLLSQARRLATAPRRGLVILEGIGQDLANTGIRREAVQGALISMTLFWGVPMLRARDASETARLILFAARQGRRIAHGAMPRPGHRPRAKQRLQCHILQGLPGVGPIRARHLIERFGSVRAVMTADSAQLAEIPGIGPAVAEAICRAVEEPPGRYTVKRQAASGKRQAPTPDGDLSTNNNLSAKPGSVKSPLK